MIRLIIFDLDDTLLDTTQLLIPIARTEAFEKRIRQPLPLMEGALDNLEALSKKYKLALLTQGRAEAQKLKISSTGIEKYFEIIRIANPELKETKESFFREIVESLKIAPGTSLSVGNRRTTDIREAKRVGILTCLFRYGEHQNEVAEIPEDVPDFEVSHHKELILKCRL